MNLTLIIGPEEQWRNYHYLDSQASKTIFYTSISGDFRASIGLNFKHFFVLLNASSDFSWYNGSQVSYLSKYGAINFLIGARIPNKTPKFYKKFQENKWYKKF